MEALSVDEIPEGPGWQYEPKWDGFRCVAFRDGDWVYLQSKSSQDLTRYFPEVVEALRKVKAARFVLDGELVIPKGAGLSFDDLLLRLHPAESRIRKLSRETPAVLITFDLLAGENGKSLLKEHLPERRAALERFAAKYFGPSKTLRLSPAGSTAAVARRWFKQVGASLDGLIAKRTDMPYASGDRTGMQKIKLQRTADCVVGGFRYASGSKSLVGSLLLGLYDDGGLLNHVGYTSGFSAGERRTLLSCIKPLIKAPGFTGSAPGGPSRWNQKRSSEWEPLDPKVVVEVTYDHFTGGRFRHGTKILRWRPDKAPRQCKMEQVKQGGAGALKLLK